MSKAEWVRMIDNEGNIFDRKIAGDKIYDIGLGNLEGDTRVISVETETQSIGPDLRVYPMPLSEAVQVGALALDRLVSQE